jgi:hypothetical protein
MIRLVKAVGSDSANGYEQMIMSTTLGKGGVFDTSGYYSRWHFY